MNSTAETGASKSIRGEAGVTRTALGGATDLIVNLSRLQLSADDEKHAVSPRRVQWIEGHTELIGISDSHVETGGGPPVGGLSPSHRSANENIATVADVIIDRGDDLYEKSKLKRSATAFSRPISYDGSEGLLQKRLFEAIDATCDDKEHSVNTGFVPKQQLHKIVDEVTVRRELERIERSFKKRIKFWKSLPSLQTIDEQATKICADSCTETSLEKNQERTSKSFRKIFAILLLIERPGTIRNFVDEGVCDADLPLVMVTRVKNKPVVSLHRKDSPSVSLKCVHGWKRVTLEQFNKLQWKTLAPFFSQGEDRRLTFYDFPDEIMLPFTYKTHVSSGAHGEVSKIKIHPEHHNFDVDNGSCEYFALKKLNGAEDAFKKEVRMLKRLSNFHQHIICLLATFQYEGCYYLIFPWADCDLETYWKSKKPKPAHDLDTLLWMARQCEVIAEGLDHIHHHETTSLSSLFAPESTEPRVPASPMSPTAGRSRPKLRPSRLVFGRHGDIKPTNLLWFPNPRDANDKGSIKISDFGAGEFSTIVSSPSTSSSIPHSPSYRPPECDLEDSTVTSSYDIWTLGCLYLEFITWYIGGWDLVKEFRQLRKQSTPGWYWTNAFFEVAEDTRDESHTVLARVKPVVLTSIQRLQDDANCSAFLSEFLSFVQDHMLIVEPYNPGDMGKRRTSCGRVYRDLGEMIERCEEDQAYAMQPQDTIASELDQT